MAIKDLQNAIIIDGTVYELVEDNGDYNECQRCDLFDMCYEAQATICGNIFDYETARKKRFKERTDL